MKISWIEGRGYDSNIYLIQADRNVLIDAGTGKNFDRIKNEIESYGIDLEEIDILINTHSHYDHVGGDHQIIEASNCELWTSEYTADVLEEGDGIKTLASNFGAKLEPLKVSRRLQENDEIDLEKTSLKVITTPGHTPGDIVLYGEEEKVLFSGDTIFKGGIGRTDLPSSDKNEMRRSLDKLTELDVDKLYPGHGPIAETNGGKHVDRASEFMI